MKPRHIAALALVGWYLMLPPIQEDQPNTDAPLSEWTISASFDTAKECQQDKGENWESILKLSPSVPTKDSIAANRQAMEAVCVATDDPRFKAK